MTPGKAPPLSLAAWLSSYRKAWLLFFVWEGVAIGCGLIAFRDGNILLAFICGALMMGALGDLKDKLAKYLEEIRR